MLGYVPIFYDGLPPLNPVCPMATSQYSTMASHLSPPSIAWLRPITTMASSSHPILGKPEVVAAVVNGARPFLTFLYDKVFHSPLQSIPHTYT